MEVEILNKKDNCRPCIKTSIGGQALLEGIMMRMYILGYKSALSLGDKENV